MALQMDGSAQLSILNSLLSSTNKAKFLVRPSLLKRSLFCRFRSFLRFSFFSGVPWHPPPFILVPWRPLLLFLFCLPIMKWITCATPGALIDGGLHRLRGQGERGRVASQRTDHPADLGSGSRPLCASFISRQRTDACVVMRACGGTCEVMSGARVRQRGWCLCGARWCVRVQRRHRNPKGGQQSKMRQTSWRCKRVTKCRKVHQNCISVTGE